MKSTWKSLDKPLLVISILLFILGLIMVFSASNVTAYMQQEVSPYNYFIKQGIFLIVGLVASLLMIKVTTRGYGVLSYLLMGIGIVAELLLPVFGKFINNSYSWYDLGFFSAQPSEFLKVITIIWLAYVYEKKKNKLHPYVSALWPLMICGIIALLIYNEPDLGTMLIYGTIVGAIFICQPIDFKVKLKIVFIILGVAAIGLGIMNATGHNILIGRQEERINAGKPCDNLLTTGNQICNGYIAINNGGLTGVGLGNSTQKYLYLPEPYTDFIFCIIVEELGLLTGIGIILCYMLLLWRILVVGMNATTDRGATMCYGVATYIFIHIAVNLLGLFGLIPMTGVPLPFMSYGGSFTICLIAALTVVQRVSIENRLQSR